MTVLMRTLAHRPRTTSKRQANYHIQNPTAKSPQGSVIPYCYSTCFPFISVVVIRHRAYIHTLISARSLARSLLPPPYLLSSLPSTIAPTHQIDTKSFPAPTSFHCSDDSLAPCSTGPLADILLRPLAYSGRPSHCLRPHTWC